MEAYVSDCTGVIVLVARVPVRPTVSIALLSEGRGVPRLGPLAGLLAGVGGRITGRGITGGGRTGVGVGRTGGVTGVGLGQPLNATTRQAKHPKAAAPHPICECGGSEAI